MERKKIAIIGTGISGLACAHWLHPQHDITVMEKDGRTGGHSNTVHVREDDQELPLDTGFMVYNEVTYPLLTRLFTELNVATKPTSMSFSVQHVADGLEFNGGSLNLLFSQRKNLLSPRFWKMLFQINRFNSETILELKHPQFPNHTLAEYVKARNYGEDFLRWYLSPMAAAVWSSPPEKIDSFPAQTLLRFWHNHGFLGLDTQHPWRTVVDGSRQYVEKLSAAFRSRIRTGNAVTSISRENSITFADGTTESFDLIISAAHGDQALELLSQPTELETSVLSKFSYQPNQAVVHSDESIMPKERRAWASWNYRIDEDAHSTIYWMNSLQGVSDSTNYFVSINPSQTIPEEKVHHSLTYEHPLFDLDAIEAQSHIPALHSAGDSTGRYFVGAWQRYGFHEDGIWSAHRLCQHLLGKDPFQ